MYRAGRPPPLGRGLAGRPAAVSPSAVGPGFSQTWRPLSPAVSGVSRSAWRRRRFHPLARRLARPAVKGGGRLGPCGHRLAPRPEAPGRRGLGSVQCSSDCFVERRLSCADRQWAVPCIWTCLHHEATGTAKVEAGFRPAGCAGAPTPPPRRPRLQAALACLSLPRRALLRTTCTRVSTIRALSGRLSLGTFFSVGLCFPPPVPAGCLSPDPPSFLLGPSRPQNA